MAKKKKDVFSLRTAVESVRYAKARKERESTSKDSVSFKEFQRRVRKNKNITGTKTEADIRRKVRKGIRAAKEKVRMLRPKLPTVKNK